MEPGSVALFISLIVGLLFYYVKKRLSYWSDRGVPYVKPDILTRAISGVGGTTIAEKVAEIYQIMKGKGVIAGLFLFIIPCPLVLDLDLLRNVFVKDFDYFQSRGLYVNESADPLSANLLAIDGEKWRNLRAKISPTFTSGRMKMMHSTFLLVAEQLKDHLRPLTEKVACEVDVKNLFGCFTMDVIGNVAFGVECNSMRDQGSEFVRMARRQIQQTTMEYLIFQFTLAFPKVAKWLNVRALNAEVTAFFMETIRKTVEYRERNNVQRNDFLQLLMQIKNTGKLDGETVELGKLTFEELAAQLFVFIMAGFETSSATMTFATYELALNQEIQENVRKEIREVLKRHEGVMSYEAVMEMTYLDQVINETLRKYPIAPLLPRKVNAAYKVPETGVVLEKDMILLIPILGIHRDPDIYPHPETFNPDRFTKENIGKRHPFAWIPFGEGKKICVGLRFGMMQTRIGLATFLDNFKVSTSELTPKTIRFHPNSPTLTPLGGLFLNVERADNLR